ncbi:uncharacterized protein BT62DRAFT_472945 [Guyanagaster necrorhizus]|uniref:Uncharacterized protein n=1 Tax=Guyanagaster necrorhizus TaxID=856835 RepID=A0A9P7VKV5_9AGAR|nr:uncharacterized protein BT62DRAFT_472945 [Guyanagaster necrorhizus MCA 3950]KAG7441764.1 hypothetical protein BT62DRAFT_472945 [Guyanagaster necrorhizus MCA 3950]
MHSPSSRPLSSRIQLSKLVTVSTTLAILPSSCAFHRYKLGVQQADLDLDLEFTRAKEYEWNVGLIWQGASSEIRSYPVLFSFCFQRHRVRCASSVWVLSQISKSFSLWNNSSHIFLKTSLWLS